MKKLRLQFLILGLGKKLIVLPLNTFLAVCVIRSPYFNSENNRKDFQIEGVKDMANNYCLERD